MASSIYPHRVIIQRGLEPSKVQEAELIGDETRPTDSNRLPFHKPLAEASSLLALLLPVTATNTVGVFHSVTLSLVHEGDSFDRVSEPLSASD